MSQFDLILHGGTIVTHQGERREDLGITDGQIAAFSPAGVAREIIDAHGLHIFPGVIDSHVHFNDPGRDDWEGIATGSSALAAGGGTLFFDMPLNSSPPTLDGPSFRAKLSAAENTSCTDFALWGGLTPKNLQRLEELAECGVVGFKAFMSASGMDDFPCTDDATLRAGMKTAAKLRKLVAVHAESDTITNELATEALAQGRLSVRDYLESRPIYAELDAIHRAIQLAAETKCALHIVHVSSGAGVALVASAQKQGVDVTCETCPHYLMMTAEDAERIGALAKCAPPLRAKSAQEVLWRYVENDTVSTIGSDHSPAPPEMKRSSNFFKIWGGISGVQHTLPLLLTGCLEREADFRKHVPDGESRESVLSSVARLTAFNVAERFGLPRGKGRIEPGADADLALVDLRVPFTVRADDLKYRHRQSPYVGRALTGRVVRTILRGQTIFQDGKIVAPPMGRLVKPA